MFDPAKKVHIKFAVLATDVVLFTIRGGRLLVRLMRVDRPPHYKNRKGLPGGLLDQKETAEQAAHRILQSQGEVADKKAYMEQLYTFSKIDRDPRNRVVSVGYTAFVPWDSLSPDEQRDTEEVWWSPIQEAKRLAYDHDDILDMALKRLHSRVAYTTVISKLMPKEFTLTDLETAYKGILGKDLDKRNFRKKILKLDILKPIEGKRTGGAFRPAQLYRFASKDVMDIEML